MCQQYQQAIVVNTNSASYTIIRPLTNRFNMNIGARYPLQLYIVVTIRDCSANPCVHP